MSGSRTANTGPLGEFWIMDGPDGHEAIKRRIRDRKDFIRRLTPRRGGGYYGVGARRGPGSFRPQRVAGKGGSANLVHDAPKTGAREGQAGLVEAEEKEKKKSRREGQGRSPSVRATNRLTVHRAPGAMYGRSEKHIYDRGHRANVPSMLSTRGWRLAWVAGDGLGSFGSRVTQEKRAQNGAPCPGARRRLAGGGRDLDRSPRTVKPRVLPRGRLRRGKAAWLGPWGGFRRATTRARPAPTTRSPLEESANRGFTKRATHLPHPEGGKENDSQWQGTSRWRLTGWL